MRLRPNGCSAHLTLATFASPSLGRSASKENEPQRQVLAPLRDKAYHKLQPYDSKQAASPPRVLAALREFKICQTRGKAVRLNQRLGTKRFGYRRRRRRLIAPKPMANNNAEDGSGTAEKNETPLPPDPPVR